MSTSLIASIAVMIITIGAIIFMAYQLMSLWIDHVKSQNHKKLREDIEAAILNGIPSWEQIRAIESTYHLLTINSLKNNLNLLIKSKVILGSQEHSAQLELLEGWKENLKSDEPFEGIPSELKLPLERIRKEAPEHQHLLEMLVSQLQEFSEKSTREKKQKNIISILSLAFGIAGFLVGAYQVYDTTEQEKMPNNSLNSQASPAGTP
jgi:hypothetical protein